MWSTQATAERARMRRGSIKLFVGVVGLVVGLAGAREKFELRAEKAWEPGSALQDAVADGTIFAGTPRIDTECYSGNDKYLRQAVLCDRQCMADVRTVARASGRPDDFRDSEKFCNGPWYCSRTTICEMYRRHDNPIDNSFNKPCTTVYGCANRSQCFPTPEDMHLMRINMHIDEWTEEETFKIRDDGFTIFYGGMKMTTTCCVNNRGRQSKYRLYVDNPCNPAAIAALPGGPFALALLTIAAFLPFIF